MIMVQLSQWLSLLLLLVGLRVSCVSDDVTQCPTWRWFNYSSGVCQCGYDLMGVIKCSEVENGSVYARFDVCVSWDNHSETLLTSLCKYKKSNSSITSRVFYKISSSPYNLSNDECELNNREGILCSRCKQGFAPSLYIFRGTCTNCSHCLQNPSSLFLFLASEILPLSVFFLIITGMHVNIVSGPMLGYVIFCQAHINTVHTYPNTWKFVLSHSGYFVNYWNTKVLLPLAGVWNLNFFAMYIPSLCYGCHFNDLTSILLQYLSVIHVLFLLIVTYYSSTKLKAKLASWCACQRIFYLCTRWRQNWNISDSTIHAFATFSALLVVKVGTISIQLIQNRKVYNINGTVVKHVLTFEPSIAVFSHQHAPYVFAAYFPVFLFLTLPAILLCLYPNRYFQNILASLCGPRKRLALAIFVDTICSGYRDGLDGGRDWRRLFPFFLTSFGGLMIFFMTDYHKHVILPDTYFIMLVPFLLFISFFFLYIKPCKTKEMNVSLSFHVIIMAVAILGLGLWIQDYVFNAETLEIFITICLTLPHAVMFVWLLRNILRRCTPLKNCYQNIRQFYLEEH